MIHRTEMRGKCNDIQDSTETEKERETEREAEEERERDTERETERRAETRQRIVFHKKQKIEGINRYRLGVRGQHRDWRSIEIGALWKQIWIHTAILLTMRLDSCRM